MQSPNSSGSSGPQSSRSSQGPHPLRRRSDVSAGRAPFIPTDEWITKLSPGDLAPDCFGHWSKVVEITYRGVDQGGQAYVGAWLELGLVATISHSYKVGRPVATIPGGSDRLGG